MKFLVSFVVGMVLSVAAAAAPLTDRFQPGTPYYFDQFDPAMTPWNPGQDLNIEEVFKLYQYYEVIFDQAGREITVNRYVQNRKARSDRFLIRTDGALEPK